MKTNIYTGDQIIDEKELSFPDIIKIDVEGAEYAVIDGLERTLDEADELILHVEVHKAKLINKYGYKQKDVDNSIDSLGFSTEVIRRENQSYYLKCNKYLIRTTNIGLSAIKKAIQQPRQALLELNKIYKLRIRG
jgi:hypothetical protein